jgi:hypothetical protein
MIDTYQLQEPINTDAECPVIPVHDYLVDTYASEFATMLRIWFENKYKAVHGKMPEYGNPVEISIREHLHDMCR